MSNADKIAIAALALTALTSMGGWILQWKVAKLQHPSAGTLRKPTPAQALVLRLIYAVIWTITILAVVIGLAGITVAVLGVVRQASVLWHILLPAGVGVVAITELALVQGIRKRLKQAFG